MATGEAKTREIEKGYIMPSAAFTLKRGQVKYYRNSTRKPEPGDVVYGLVSRIGEHSTLENASGRLHMIQDGTKAVFVFGNRYAPDYFEGMVPERYQYEVDLLARSGIVGMMSTKNSSVKDPTRIKLLGYVCGENGFVLNTRAHSLITPRRSVKKQPRSPMILVCGTAMNSGKSRAAVACCWALSSAGCKVRASKVTGTASLKDVLHMNDAGAHPYADFTYMGYPSTYMLDKRELLEIFNHMDLKYANNPKNHWVVEFADGINQRETAILLGSRDVRDRISKLIFCANDAFGAMGGLAALRDDFGLVPDAISGLCSSSPLYVRELQEVTSIPIFNSMTVDPGQLSMLLLPD